LPRFKNDQFEIITRIPEWARAFQVEPREIERQIGIAHAWINNNPKKGPKKSVMRFLNNWMSIADRKQSLRRNYREAPKIVDVEPDMTFEEMVEIRRRNMGVI